MNRTARLLPLPLVLLAGLLGGPPAAHAAEAPRVLHGTLADGAEYVVEVPQHWNGTLALFSHGLRFPGEDSPAEDAYSDGSRAALLAQGIALAGSSYSGNGWVVEEAVHDQLATLDAVETRVGTPSRVVAWGESLGGLVTSLLVEQAPDRISAALPMCQLGGGGVRLWDSYLDAAYVLDTLLPAGARPAVTGITDPLANLGTANELLGAAAGTPAGRARLALAAAVMQVPGAVDPLAPQPTDAAGRAEARLRWMVESFPVFAYAERGDLEARSGGNPSGNVGVDYARLLRSSQQRPEVRAAYAAAGLDLDADLDALAAAPRVSPDPGARSHLAATASVTGDLTRPVLTLHTTADGLVPTWHERAYADSVAAAGSSDLLRQSFVDRAGHCTFTSAEVLAAFETLQSRLETGTWSVRPEKLSRLAAALGPELNSGGGVHLEPAFTRHHPRQLARG
ncbi:hypothetical protein CLV35_2069 [Motilibacter peucedani]|uniref:Prolyl oligopeptidase family protein n=1 Tax=Motilibacter peucedani TaxID=598650 RepID=A0A420XQR9_9ACTN|nr:alpha/beta hydrolase [Motilibacter peucedani]RKS75595.1 hypothetical protein CLV35_2069 [Motilibacter peucedani]